MKQTTMYKITLMSSLFNLKNALHHLTLKHDMHFKILTIFFLIVRSYHTLVISTFWGIDMHLNNVCQWGEHNEKEHHEIREFFMMKWLCLLCISATTIPQPTVKILQMKESYYRKAIDFLNHLKDWLTLKGSLQ